MEVKTEEDGVAEVTAGGHPAPQQPPDIRHSVRKSGAGNRTTPEAWPRVTPQKFNHVLLIKILPGN